MAVWACALLLTTPLRAQVPENPLRSRSSALGSSANRPASNQWQAVPGTLPIEVSANRPVADELRRVAQAWQDSEPEHPVKLVQVAEELPSAQPETVVPQQFGQPPADAQEMIWAEEETYPGEAWPAEPPSAHHRGLFRRRLFGQGLFHGGLFRNGLFGHTDPNDPYRHWGPGDPLIGTSWRNRPWYFGLFVGGVLNDDLIDGRVLQNNSTYLGMRLGVDFDHYWGLEARYAFARPETMNVAGTPLPEQARDYYGDISLLYYPWGDSRWRPYLSAGLGFVNYRFEDDLGAAINDSAFEIPLGVGLKYYYCNWFTIRFDLVNNITFATSNVDGMDNISFMAGAEYRFGGKSPSYFPWHGNTAYW